MKAGLAFIFSIALYCSPQWVNGEVALALKDTLSARTLVTDSKVEMIPGINAGNISGKKDTVNVDADSITFAVYFGGSACRDVRYAFEKRADSLLILQYTGICYRHQQAYGVRGRIKNLESGRYRFIVSMNPESVLSAEVLQQDVIIH